MEQVPSMAPLQTVRVQVQTVRVQVRTVRVQVRTVRVQTEAPSMQSARMTTRVHCVWHRGSHN